MRTILIGSSPYADIVISDPTVAPRHLEVVIPGDGRLFVTDCASAVGSFYRPSGAGEGAQWQPLRQAFLDRGTALCLGSHVTSLGLMIAPMDTAQPMGGPALGPARPAEGAVSGDGGGAGGAGPGRGGPRTGRMIRDPNTGEVVVLR